jgi:riboflavin kinase/FMN adenylyltransferase
MDSKIQRVVQGTVPHPSWAGCCVTLGNFDGLHLGHREILGSLRAMADRNHAPALAVTFHPHPAEVIAGKSPKRLMSIDDRVEALLANGADAVWVVPFSLEYAQVGAIEFVEETLLGALAIRGFVAGPDTRFGAGRRGDAELLGRYAAAHRFDLEVLEPFELDGKRISSSAIRTLLLEGQVQAAARMLGRPYRHKGTVVRGMRMGTQLGFPTANLALSPDLLIPARGIYVVQVRVRANGDDDVRRYEGVANVGVRPTVDDGPLVVEAHLFGVNGELYGERISLEYLMRLRDEERFGSLEELKAAIARDVARAKAWFRERAVTSA